MTYRREVRDMCVCVWGGGGGLGVGVGVCMNVCVRLGAALTDAFVYQEN